MTVLYEPVWGPQGMSREECDALCRDLARAGIEVRRVEEPSPGVFRVAYFNPGLRVEFTITNAALFRKTAAAGLHEGLPPEARTLLADQPQQREIEQ